MLCNAMQVWCLRVSHVGDFVLSGSHDRSIRRWDKSDEVFFLEEEKEKRLERVLDNNEVVRNADAFTKPNESSVSAAPSKSQV
jgi:U3 small nucleolar RNA-associated protein 12